MASPVQICIEVLTGAMGMTPEVAKAHAFTAYIAEVEKKAKRARWAYPAVYIVLGGIFLLCLDWFASPGPEKWSKLIGAILSVFSALLAFWKPGTEVAQRECKRFLSGAALAGSDLADLNKALEVSGKDFEKVMKLLGAVVSFVAAYLLIGV